MLFWEIFAIAGVVFLILEILVPSVFFLNFAVAGFLTAILSLVVPDIVTLILAFVVFSLLSILLIRPMILKNKKKDDMQTGIEGKYIGKIARVIEPVNKYKGAITIYDERWDARYDGDEEIPVGAEIRIVHNESLVMYVEKI